MEQGCQKTIAMNYELILELLLEKKKWYYNKNNF